MLWAEFDYWTKTRANRSAFSGDYTLVFLYSFYKSAYGSGAGSPENGLFWNYGKCEEYTMSTDQLNQYLLSSKEMIDENNPAVYTDDILIGYFYWNCWNTGTGTPGPFPGGEWTTLPWFQHAVAFHIYKKVFVGPIED